MGTEYKQTRTQIGGQVVTFYHRGSEIEKCEEEKMKEKC